MLSAAGNLDKEMTGKEKSQKAKKDQERNVRGREKKQKIRAHYFRNDCVILKITQEKQRNELSGRIESENATGYPERSET